MGIIFGKTIPTSTIRPYMINKLYSDRVTLLNGDHMTYDTTLIFDDDVKEKCHELLQFIDIDEVKIYYQGDIIYGICSNHHMYGPKLSPGSCGYYLIK